MDAQTRHTRRWWGDHELAMNEGARFRVGPLHLHLRRRPYEWQVASLSHGDPKDETAEVEVPSATPPPAGAALRRYTMQTTPARFRLSARLADRPVVIKPESPLFVPPGEHVTLFVGSPLWVVVSVGDPAVELAELPAHRATDTWFGPNTRVGDLCYGSRTLARLRLEDCTVRPHRAITAMDVRNDAGTELLIEQVQLPAPRLALFVTADDTFWTQSVTLVRESDSDRVRLRIADSAYPAGGVLRRVAEPRDAGGGNLIFQAFSRLFG